MKAMRTMRRRVWSILTTVLACGVLLAVLASCGGSAAPTPARESRAGGASQSGADAGSAGKPAAAAAPTSAAAAAAPAPGANPAQQPAITQPEVPKKIIKNGNLGLVVKNVDSGVAQVRGIALRFGGDVAQSTITSTDDRHVADMVIQVESARFDEAMDELRRLNGDVLERRVDKTDSKDVTEEFVDLEAQINNLRATERQLLTVLDKATRTEDILAVQREITNVRGQIDRLQGRANYLDRRAAMSTITLHLEPEGPPARPRPAAGWRLSDVVTNAWNSSLRVLQGLLTVVVSVAVFSWWLLPLLGLGWLALRRAGRRLRPARPAPPPPPAPATGD